MKKKRFQSIQTKLSVLFILMLLLLSVGMLVYFAYNSSRIYYQQVKSRLDDLTTLSENNMNNEADAINQLSVMILTDPTVQSVLPVLNTGEYETEESKSHAIELIKSSVVDQVFSIYDVLEARIYSLNSDMIKVGHFFLREPEFAVTGEEILEANGGTVWKVDISHKYVCLARAILSKETMQPIGWMTITCNVDYLSRDIKTDMTANSGILYLIDQDGNVIASNENTLIGETFPYSIEELKAAEDLGSGSTIRDPATGERCIVRVGDTLSSGWTIISMVSLKSLNSIIHRSIFHFVILITLSVIAIMIASSIMIRRMHKPMKNLTDSMSSFGGGDLKSRAEITSNDEIASIGMAYNEMADHLENLMDRVYALEIANREAEIEFLKMQINPHFLYNSLDTISWMSFMHGDEDVSDMSVAMARLLRASIQRADKIPVAQELTIAKDYLKIQGYRFGDKIRTSFDIDPEAEECKMPGFILQPVIENAIIHGLEGLPEGGQLRISIKHLDKTLYFCVADNGAGMNSEQLTALMNQCRGEDSNKSIGLKNVYRRLHLIFGDACNFHIESEEGKGTTVSFEIPIE